MPIGMKYAQSYCMNHLVFLIALLLSLNSFSKILCEIDISSPRERLSSNKDLNSQLKQHQKISHIKIEIDSLNLKNKSLHETKLYFQTLDSKKFESVYKPYSGTQALWKVDFSKSQIFPQLFKNYVNIIEYDSKFFIRMYDSPKEKSLISLSFEKRDCSEILPKKIITGSR